jgi:hypothetical protein
LSGNQVFSLQRQGDSLTVPQAVAPQSNRL